MKRQKRQRSGRTKTKNNRRDAATRTQVQSRHNDATKFYTLLVLMRDGQPEFRRFHVAVDSRGLTPAEHGQFCAWALRSLGIPPESTADLGEQPVLKIEAFDTEAECKAHYDWLLTNFGTKPKEGAGPLCKAFDADVNSKGGQS